MIKYEVGEIVKTLYTGKVRAKKTFDDNEFITSVKRNDFAKILRATKSHPGNYDILHFASNSIIEYSDGYLAKLNKEEENDNAVPWEHICG